MASSKSIWGIDIGQCALKALKLAEVDGQLQVEAFDVVEHERVLSEPGVDRDASIRKAMATFLSRNPVHGETVAISVPGQSSFTRFVKLPPVEPKRIPSIVKFEAEQQIPFKIEEVIWRWQPFHDPDSPDVEVGIFAMKREDVAEVMGYLSDSELSSDLVQMAPLSLYNFLTVDQTISEDGATLLMDVGADKTDLIVADGARLWTRTIQIGGNDFTEALVRAFKLSFAKAENLKRTAATSKYARQIFQAMRPVFADLVQEIQRSIGYYTSLHREARFKKLVGMGNGFKLPGLQKFIEQNLSISVVRVDSFNKLSLAPSVNAASFNENILSLGVAYGLAAQGLDFGRVQTNLLPDEIARKRRWDAKRPMFVAAAAVLLVVMAVWVYRQYSDKSALGDTSNALAAAKKNVSELNEINKAYKSLRSKGGKEVKEIKSTMQRYGYRNYWPSVLSALTRAVDAVAEDNDHFRRYAVNVETAATIKARLESDALQVASKEERQLLEDELKDALEQIEVFKNIPRDERQVMIIQQVDTRYLPDVTKVEAARPTKAKKTKPGMMGPMMGPMGMPPMGMGRPARPAPAAGRPAARRPRGTVKKDVKRGFVVEMQIRTPLDMELASQLITKLGQEADRKAEEFDVFKIEKWEIVEVQQVALDTLTRATRERVPAAAGRRAAGPMMGPRGMGAPMGNGAPRRAAKPAVPAAEQPAGPDYPDPIIPSEDMSSDNVIKVRWIITVENDGLKLPEFSVAQDGRKSAGSTKKPSKRSRRRR